MRRGGGRGKGGHRHGQQQVCRTLYPTSPPSEGSDAFVASGPESLETHAHDMWSSLEAGNTIPPFLITGRSKIFLN
eukprot:1572406-Amphidinium_carterae.1